MNLWDSLNQTRVIQGIIMCGGSVWEEGEANTGGHLSGLICSEGIEQGVMPEGHCQRASSYLSSCKISVK